MIVYLDKVIRPLVLRLPKMSGYVKTFKEKSHESMSLCIDDGKGSEKYKTISSKIEDIKNVSFNALPVYDDRYIKPKIRTYGDKMYTNFRGLNVPGDSVVCELFTVISIDSLLVYEYKYYLQVYVHYCAYKTVNTW